MLHPAAHRNGPMLICVFLFYQTFLHLNISGELILSGGFQSWPTVAMVLGYSGLWSRKANKLEKETGFKTYSQDTVPETRFWKLNLEFLFTVWQLLNASEKKNTSKKKRWCDNKCIYKKRGMEEKIRPILALFEIVHSHVMALSHTELKPPSFLRAFKRVELFADWIPVLLGTIPKLVGINECLFWYYWAFELRV